MNALSGRNRVFDLMGKNDLQLMGPAGTWSSDTHAKGYRLNKGGTADSRLQETQPVTYYTPGQPFSCFSMQSMASYTVSFPWLMQWKRATSNALVLFYGNTGDKISLTFAVPTVIHRHIDFGGANVNLGLHSTGIAYDGGEEGLQGSWNLYFDGKTGTMQTVANFGAMNNVTLVGGLDVAMTSRNGDLIWHVVMAWDRYLTQEEFQFLHRYPYAIFMR